MLSAGTSLGPYEILAPIGAGGMGEVYKARDTRLGRIVAIKVLAPHVADQPELKERFAREAHAVAALNHPHICVLHDIGSQDGTDYLVMEHIEGETLAARLTRAGNGAKDRPLRLEEALRYGIEIADALDKAHRAGIVHRDLKPGNIMLTKSGVKLLDFGLAKLRTPEAAVVMSAATTQPAPLTARGTLLGTVPYMAPEQLEGQEADARTDIFAFGAVLYEMVTGRRAFEGTSPASVMAAIMNQEPPALSALQPLTPASLEHVVAKCLAKEPDDRWQTMRDVGHELKWVEEGGGPTSSGAAVGRQRRVARERVAWALAIIVAVAAASAATLYLSRAAVADAPVWASILPPEGGVGRSPAPAVSPDGRTITFAAPDASGTVKLWLRSLDSPDARALPGTDDADGPFWAPDGRSLGFFAGLKLKRIDIGAAAPQILADVSGHRGGTWSRDGTIVFVPTADAPLHRIAATGGDAVPLVFDGPAIQSPMYPHFLPDGQHLLFTTYQGAETSRGVWAASLGSKTLVRVGGMRSRVMYSSGYLLFGNGRDLFAQPFDVDRLGLNSEPARIATTLGVSFNTSVAYAFSVASTGDVLAFWSGSWIPTTQLTWYDRQGTRLGTVGEPGEHASIALGRDDQHIALERRDVAKSTNDVWILDARSGMTSRFTSDSLAIMPVWAPDGGSLAFLNFLNRHLQVRTLDGESIEDIALDSPRYPADWSPDRRFIVLGGQDPKTLSDVWLLPLSGDRQQRPYLQTGFMERVGRVSPDGRWFAYSSDESGRFEIYIQSFPAPGHKVRVSTGGGEEPHWHRRGNELYYVSPDRKLMVASVVVEGATLRVGAPQVLFDAPLVYTVSNRSQYAVSADGKRFLFNEVQANAAPRAITVGLHWPAGLKK